MYNQRGQSAEGPISESPSIEMARKASGKLYKNPLDCLIQTVRTEGPLAVYKVLSFCARLMPGIFRTFITDCTTYHIVSALYWNFANFRTLTFMEQVPC